MPTIEGCDEARGEHRHAATLCNEVPLFHSLCSTVATETDDELAVSNEWVSLFHSYEQVSTKRAGAGCRALKGNQEFVVQTPLE